MSYLLVLRSVPPRAHPIPLSDLQTLAIAPLNKDFQPALAPQHPKRILPFNKDFRRAPTARGPTTYTQIFPQGYRTAPTSYKASYKDIFSQQGLRQPPTARHPLATKVRTGLEVCSCSRTWEISKGGRRAQRYFGTLLTAGQKRIHAENVHCGGLELGAVLKGIGGSGGSGSGGSWGSNLCLAAWRPGARGRSCALREGLFA